MGGQKVWLVIALALTITGILMMVLTLPAMSSQVIAHEEIVFMHDIEETPEYQLEAGDYSVWVEDYFPGFDDGEEGFVAAICTESSMLGGWRSSTYHTRTIDGVDCEHAGAFDDVQEGDYSFEIQLFGNITDDPIQVFIVRENKSANPILFSMGVVFLSMGLIAIGLVYRDKRAVKDDIIEEQ
jgi:hypothetical protein